MNPRALALLLLAVVALGGCATCRQHPVACVGAAVVVGAIAAHELDRPDADPVGRRARHGKPGRD